MTGFDLHTVSDIKYNGNTVNSVWFRGTLIWPPNTPPTPQPSYWSTQYLQTTLLSYGQMKFSIPAGISTSDCTSISYSTDKVNWVTTANIDSTAVDITTPYYQANTVIYWKGIGTKLSKSSSASGCRLSCGIYNSDGFNVAGNIMSLLYGDNFIGQTTLPSTYTFAHLFHKHSSNSCGCVNAENLILPATTLTEGCYMEMFGGANGNVGDYLIKAPELLASTLADFCYYRMFIGCTSLNYIKCLATDRSGDRCLYEWVKNVGATGTFIKDANTSWSTGDSGIPPGWTIENQERDDPGPEPINWAEEYMQVIAADPLTITTDIGTTYTYQFIIPQYSLDGVTWNSWNNSVSLNLNADDIVYFKGTYNAGSYSQYNSKPLFKTTTANAHYDIAGNAMSLLYGDNFIGQTSIASYSSCFRRLFYNCSNMIDASRLILPATTLSNLCYHTMFEACSSLEVAPELPALTCANECYHDMFHGCALVEPPELPATTLAQYCYAGMFNGNPFTSITLPATTLTTRCYEWMFYNCSHLNEITCLATTNITTNNLYNWTGGVSANGTFIKDANASYSTGTNGIPSGWTVQNAS